jgi:hypothetical protein
MEEEMRFAKEHRSCVATVVSTWKNFELQPAKPRIYLEPASDFFRAQEGFACNCELNCANRHIFSRLLLVTYAEY